MANLSLGAEVDSLSSPGTIGLAVTLNHDAEAACAASSRAQQSVHQKISFLNSPQEAKPISGDALASLAKTEVVEISDIDAELKSGVQTTKNQNSICGQNEASVRSGIDAVTGVIWRKDDFGHR